jgi:hypothetical protein
LIITKNEKPNKTIAPRRQYYLISLGKSGKTSFIYSLTSPFSLSSELESSTGPLLIPGELLQSPSCSLIVIDTPSLQPELLEN